MTKDSNIDMIHGTLWKNLFRYALPLMISNALIIFFHSADTIIVGKFAGQRELAAVGSTSPVSIFFTWGFSGLSVGADVLVSQMIGAGKSDDIQKAVHTSIAIALYGGILMTVLGVSCTSLFMQILSTPNDIFSLSTLYLRIYFLTLLPVSLFDFAASILRSKGDTKRPTLYLSVTGLLNVFLNLIFVIVFHWGVAGVAIATVISQTLAAILILWALIKEEGDVHLDLRKIRMDPSIAIQTLKIGIPSALQNMLFSLSNMAVQSSINSFGSVAVAGNAAALAIEDYVYVFVDSFPKAAITFTGQNYGAKNYANIKKILMHCLLITTAGSVLIGCFCTVYGKYLLYLFTNEQSVIEAGLYRLRWVTFFLFLNGILDVIVGSMRGMGYSSVPTIITMIGIVGIRLSYIFLVFARIRTLSSLYLCFPLSWLVTSVIQLCLWHHIYVTQKT
ncbi:MAG: MATE family efflux transporter [Solobacterium sp.]|nr:MATE family efflux transporter [Solobacterium sp.]